MPPSDTHTHGHATHTHSPLSHQWGQYPETERRRRGRVLEQVIARALTSLDRFVFCEQRACTGRPSKEREADVRGHTSLWNPINITRTLWGVGGGLESCQTFRR